MPELRFDPIKRHHVIIAGDRARRPSEFTIQVESCGPEQCPFCPGNEDQTPRAILTLNSEGVDSGTWSARLIANKFPAMEPNSVVEGAAGVLFPRSAARGRHEVMVESAHHDARQGGYSTSHFTRLLGVYQSRIREFVTIDGSAYVALFTNVGYRGGATLKHPHSQIVGLPMVPDAVKTELTSSVAHLNSTGRCLFCEVIESEIADGSRVIFADEDFVVITPFASRFAYEFTIYPRIHEADFAEADAAVLSRLADALQRSLGMMDRALHRPDYNLVLHTAPAMEESWDSGTIARAFHWHFEVIPRVSTLAGMEWGTGIHISSVLPERASAFLAESLAGGAANST